MASLVLRISEKSLVSEIIFTAVASKRAGGMGLISWRKAFQKPVQDAPASEAVTVA